MRAITVAGKALRAATAAKDGTMIAKAIERTRRCRLARASGDSILPRSNQFPDGPLAAGSPSGMLRSRMDSARDCSTVSRCGLE